MALISFLSHSTDLGGSGLGFYGNSFGASVAVGQFQDNTYITDANGASQGPAANNIKYVATQSGASPTTVLNLLDITNSKATLNVRFTHTDPVLIHNAQLRIYDRTSINNPASGVVTKVAELQHTSLVESGTTGLGDSSWAIPGGTGYLALGNSPGTSGVYANGKTGSVTPDVRHDWYLALSSSPSSIGSKTQFALFVSIEYL